jgi:hypothetical protein
MNAELVKVRCGACEVPVESTPLATRSANFATHVLTQPREDLIVLRPTPLLEVIGRGILLVSFIPAAIAVLGMLTCGGWAPVFVLGGAVLAAFLARLFFLRLPWTHVFDLQQGTWTARGLFASAGCPLHQVVAVQMNPGRGLNAERPGRGSRRYPGYELNLVLEDDPPRRVSLTCHGSGPVTWQTGRYLAHVLRVPFLEQAPAAAGPGVSPRAPSAARVLPRTCGWLFAAFGTLVLVAGCGLLTSSWLFYLRAERGAGTVTDLVRGNKGMVAPVVAYEVGGKAYTYRSSLYSSPPAYQVGEQVPLLYDPADPSSCRTDSFFEAWGLALLFATPGAALAYVGFACLAWRPMPAKPRWPDRW